MKILGMTTALLLAVVSGSVWAQSGGNTPEKPTPAAGGAISTKPGTQSAAVKKGLRAGNGTKLSQSGTVSDNSRSNEAASGQGGKGKTVNQQAAGVPTSGSASTSRSRKSNRN